MFNRLCLLVVLATAVNGCVKTANKRNGEACGCSDACLDNSYCLRDTQGTLTCQCLPCQFFDSDLGQCVDLSTAPSNEGQSCNGVCAAPYVCVETSEGSQERTCQPCPNTQYYDEELATCVDLPGFGEACEDSCICNLECQSSGTGVSGTCGCLPGTQDYSPSLGYCTFECLSNTTTGCQCVPDGDYPACDPLCQDGVYVSCYKNVLYVRDCGLGWYRGPDGTRFTANLVYDPTLRRCERATSYCPRALDDQVEG